MDLKLPRLHGLDVLRQLPEPSNTKTVVLSMLADEFHVVEAVKNGAFGYVLKDCSSSELFAAIREVASGNQYLCEPLRQRTLTATLKRMLPGVRSCELTQREVVVLELAAEGKTSAEIAKCLFISRRTAEAHRAKMMKKLGLKTQTELVLYALRSGLLAA